MEVRTTCRWVAEHASHVTINAKGIEKVVGEVNGTLPDIKWDFEGIHFFDNGPLTAQYMLVLDALNFCFWPVGAGWEGRLVKLEWGAVLHSAPCTCLPHKADCVERTRNIWQFPELYNCSMRGVYFNEPHQVFNMLQYEELHYDHLARGLKRALEADNTAFNADRLQTYTGPLLRKLLHWPRKLPLEDERARLIREVGLALEKHFGGLASNLVAASKGSAVALVELVVSYFPGFRDHSIYKSHQIFIYKRAQIFVADLWGAFQGHGLGEFRDIGCITMFADYVVPAVLRQKGILEYSPSLANAVDHQKELAPGSEEEVEIRACTITAIEQLRETLMRRVGKEVTSVQVDWWLWSFGIETIGPSLFHHTKTVYY